MKPPPPDSNGTFNRKRDSGAAMMPGSTGLAVLFWLSVVTAIPHSSEACQICIPFPEKTAADFILESDAVVLAREDPERPFYFAPIETLSGDPGEEKIDLFLDSSTRRLLSLEPELAVVLVKHSDSGTTEWLRIGIADDPFARVIQTVLKNAGEWRQGSRRRIDYFASRLGHENLQVRSLARLEVARASYSEIRNLRGILPRQEIRAFLSDYRYIEWHPLYILLLAQSDHPDDRAYIADSIDTANRFGLTGNLAAWATAYIAQLGIPGVDYLRENYLQRTDRTPEEISAVLEALSVHGTEGDPSLRDEIVGAYGELLARYPSMALRVVRDLEAWKRRDHADLVARIAAAKPSVIDFTTTLQLRAYARIGGPN